MFTETTGLSLKPSQHRGYWRSIQHDEEFDKIKAWITAQRERVFMRDTLPASLALSENFSDDNTRTQIGELECRAKYDRDGNALQQLVRLCAALIEDLPFFRDATVIAAVPPGKDKDFDLPSAVARGVARARCMSEVTSALTWENDKIQLKNLVVEEKWDSLDEAHLLVIGNIATDRVIILIDDLYQSGTTLQYVAMKLQEAGASAILGLSLVKSRRDTDNA